MKFTARFLSIEADLDRPNLEYIIHPQVTNDEFLDVPVIQEWIERANNLGPDELMDKTIVFVNNTDRVVLLEQRVKTEIGEAPYPNTEAKIRGFVASQDSRKKPARSRLLDYSHLLSG